MSLSPHEKNLLLQSLVIRQSSTVASLVVLLYEYVIMFENEFRHIWRRPFKLNQVVYLFSRYFCLVVQSVNTYLALGPHSSLSTDESTCRQWQLFQALASFTLAGALHLILMLMVYALHFKDWKIGIFFILLYITQIALQAFVTPKGILHVQYDPICDIKEVNYDNAMCLGISTLVIYISLVILTVVKWDLVRLGAPVVKRVIRDGALIIMILCPTFTAMISYSWVRQVAQGHILFGWSNTIISIACCRIIMNMETLNYADSEHDQIIGFNSFDNLQLMCLERDRRELEGLETDSSHNA